MKIAAYPGSFDPFTNGHMDILKRATSLFDKVIVAVTNNPNKKFTFTLEERREMVLLSTKGFKNLEVDSFSGLLVDYVKRRKAMTIVRGLRAVSDFEYEFQIALMNRRLNYEVDTIFFMPDEKYAYLSSSIVKEIAKFGGNIKGLVPEAVERKLKNIINTLN